MAYTNEQRHFRTEEGAMMYQVRDSCAPSYSDVATKATFVKGYLSRAWGRVYVFSYDGRGKDKMPRKYWGSYIGA